MKKFLTDQFKPEEANVIVFGIALGKRSKEALQSLREVSWFVEPYDVEKRKNLLENVRIADIGDLEIKNFDDLEKVSTQVENMIIVDKIPTILGGGHLLTFYSFKSLKDTKMIIFDAHFDMKDEYIDEKIVDLDFISDDVKLDSRLNDSTWLRRLTEIVNPENIVLIGARSGDEEELEYAKKIKYITSNQIKENLQNVKNFLKEFTKDSPIYVSLDVDCFDPSIAPGVDHPEPNGLGFKEFLEIVDSVDGKIIGMDLVCLKPIKDNQITEFLAIKSVFEILRKI